MILGLSSFKCVLSVSITAGMLVCRCQENLYYDDSALEGTHIWTPE